MTATKTVASATSTDATRTADASGELITDEQGRLIVNLASILGVTIAPVTPGMIPVTPVQPTWTKSALLSLGANGDVLVVAGAVRLQRILITIFTGNGFLYVCDKVAIPPTLATIVVPPIPFAVATTASPVLIDQDYDNVGGIPCATGIVLGISSTGPAFTALAGATANVTVWYR